MTEPCDEEIPATCCRDLPVCCCYPERGVDKYLSCVTWSVAIGYILTIICAVSLVIFLVFACIHAWILSVK